MAKKKSSTRGASDYSGGVSGRTLLALCLAMAMAFFFKSTFLLFLVGMLPSIIAFYVDTARVRTLFATVFACNLAGVLPYVADLVASQNSSNLAVRHLMDVQVWFMMYFSAGLGWFLIKWGAAVVEFVLTLSARAKIARLEAMQRKLVEEWGTEVSQEEGG